MLTEEQQHFLFAGVPPENYWYIRIPGQPPAKKRVGHRGRRTFNPSDRHEERFRDSVFISAPSLPRSDPRSLFGVRAIFWCSPDHPVPDGDNCMKLVLDALQHAIWENDRQVREQASHIGFSPRNPRTDLVIWRLTADWIE